MADRNDLTQAFHDIGDQARANGRLQGVTESVGFIVERSEDESDPFIRAFLRDLARALLNKLTAEEAPSPAATELQHSN